MLLTFKFGLQPPNTLDSLTLRKIMLRLSYREIGTAGCFTHTGHVVFRQPVER